MVKSQILSIYNVKADALINKISKSSFANLYKEVIGKWETKNGVILTYADDGDGLGMESWYEVVPQAAPSAELKVSRKLK